MTLKRLVTSLIFICAISLSAQIEEKQLDQLIQETLTTFDVPGISVGIFKDGKEVYAKGYGVRSLTSKKENSPVSLRVLTHPATEIISPTGLSLSNSLTRIFI